MTPRSFDAATSREMVGDTRARSIETLARTHADVGKHAYCPPHDNDSSYWGGCRNQFERAVYHEQFRKRLERNARKVNT